MRDLCRFNLSNIKNVKNWKSNFFPNTKLNYTSEILLWYYLFILLKKIKLKKGQKIIAFEMYQKNANQITLKLICHGFNFHDETEFDRVLLFKTKKSEKRKKNKSKLLSKMLGLKKEVMKNPFFLVLPKSFVFIKKYFSLAKIFASIKNKTKNSKVFFGNKISLFPTNQEFWIKKNNPKRQKRLKKLIERFFGKNKKEPKNYYSKSYNKNFHFANKKFISFFLTRKFDFNQILSKTKTFLFDTYPYFRYFNNIGLNKNKPLHWKKKFVVLDKNFKKNKEIFVVKHLLYNEEKTEERKETLEAKETKKKLLTAINQNKISKKKIENNCDFWWYKFIWNLQKKKEDVSKKKK